MVFSDYVNCTVLKTRKEGTTEFRKIRNIYFNLKGPNKANSVSAVSKACYQMINRQLRNQLYGFRDTLIQSCSRYVFAIYIFRNQEFISKFISS